MTIKNATLTCGKNTKPNTRHTF